MTRIIDIIKKYKLLIISIITMALPAIIEMALNTLVGLADTLMISYLVGSDALAAVGFANQILFAIIFIFSSFNTGATALVSRSYGEKDFDKLNRVAGQTISVNLLIGLIITVLSILFGSQIFNIFDTTQVVQDMILQYYYVVLIGMIPMFFLFSGAAILRGAGNTFTPMIITGVSNVINIIGNYILITGVGPFPKMGIAGAALSTSIARILAMAMYFYVLYNKDSNINITIDKMKITKGVLKPLWKLSYPGAIEQFFMQTSGIVIGVIVSKLDTISEAAFRILLQIESISYMPAVGLSIAAATLVGKALGEKDEEKSVNIGYASFALSIGWGIFIGILFIIFPSAILKIFTPEVQIIAMSAPVMFIVGLNQPLLNLIIVEGGALRGAADTARVMIITMLRIWVVQVPAAYLFVLVLKQDIKGVWLAEMVSFSIFAIVLFIRFYRRKWTKIKINIQ